MMMMGDRKKTVAAILGPAEEKKGAEGAQDVLHAVSGELIDAVHAKDEAGVAAALRAAFAECGASSSEESSED